MSGLLPVMQDLAPMRQNKPLYAFSYFGGKRRLLDFILSVMPPQGGRHLVDVFGGSGVVCFNAPYKYKTYNDIDGRIVNFFTVLRDRGDELRELIALTPDSRLEHERGNAPGAYEAADALEQARLCYLMFSQNRNAQANGKAAWHFSPHGKRRRPWQKTDADLAAISALLRSMTIENLPWDACLAKYERKGKVLFYLDPPYLPETRASLQAYKHELSYEEHERLLNALIKLDCQALISGYDNELYNNLLSDWRKVVNKELPKPSAMQKSAAREVVWANFDAAPSLDLTAARGLELRPAATAEMPCQ